MAGAAARSRADSSGGCESGWMESVVPRYAPNKMPAALKRRYFELIRAGIEMPSGVLIFEDPPVHTIHRRLMSRVFSRVFHKLSDIPTYPKEGPSQVLVSRAVIDVVV